MIAAIFCVCGEALRFVRTRNRYEPLAGSGSPIVGHVPAVAVVDGVRTVVRKGAVCTAEPKDELAPRRKFRASGRAKR